MPSREFGVMHFAFCVSKFVHNLRPRSTFGPWSLIAHIILFIRFHYSNSGLLEKLIAAGKEYIFISNVDNLGAVVDLNIMQTMIDSQAEYVMEVTDKTKADIKGGTIIDYEGKARLLEVAQVPKDHLDEFCSTRKFKVSPGGFPFALVSLFC